MSEQAAHAAGPPGSAALPQRHSLPLLGQSPQLPRRTASFDDDGCVASHSNSNYVAAPKSETIHDGRHPIYDGGALAPTLQDDPAAIGHFIQPPDGMAEDEWIDFVRHYESEYISDLPVADVIS